MSVLLALLASLAWGVADFAGGTAARRVPVLGVVLGSQALALLVLVPVVLLHDGLGTDAGYLLPGVLAGLTAGAALLAFYRALAVGTMGVVAPVAALGGVLPLGLGLLRGETPSLGAVAGLLLAVVGVVLAAGPDLGGRRGPDGHAGPAGDAAAALGAATGAGAASGDAAAGAGAASGDLAAVGTGAVPRPRLSGRPLPLAALAGTGFGLLVVLVGEGGRTSVLGTLLTMRATTVALLLAGLGAARLRGRGAGLVRLPRAVLPLVALGGCGDLLANGLLAAAAGRGGALVSVTGVLASLYPLVTVLLARWLLAERLTRVQVVGAGTVVAGVALTAAL